MWVFVILFFLMGMGLLTTELFIPGFGVFGISGLVFLIISSVVTVLKLPFGVYILAGMLVALALGFFSLIRYIKRKQLYGKIILNESLDYCAKEIDDLEPLLGKEGLTKTALKPFGIVEFNGKSIDAYSDCALIPEKRRVKVVEVRKDKIIVTPVN